MQAGSLFLVTLGALSLAGKSREIQSGVER